jgi:hypothetical protein
MTVGRLCQTPMLDWRFTETPYKSSPGVSLSTRVSLLLLQQSCRELER